MDSPGRCRLAAKRLKIIAQGFAQWALPWVDRTEVSALTSGARTVWGIGVKFQLDRRHRILARLPKSETANPCVHRIGRHFQGAFRVRATQG